MPSQSTPPVPRRKCDPTPDWNQFFKDLGLIHISHQGDIMKVRESLAAGEDVNASTNQGITALMAAAINGHSEVTRQLLAHGADVKAKGIWEETALWFMMRHNAPLSVVQLLLDAGADVHAKDIFGKTAMMKALKAGETEMVLLLKQAGVRR